MADEDILGSLGLDASSYLATLAQVETASADFVSRTQAQFNALVLPAPDMTAYTAGLAGATAAAQQAASQDATLASQQNVLAQASQVAGAALAAQAAAQQQAGAAATATSASTQGAARDLGVFADAIASAKQSVADLQTGSAAINARLGELRADASGAGTASADLALALGEAQQAGESARQTIAGLSGQLAAYRTATAEGAQTTAEEAAAASMAAANLSELRSAQSTTSTAVQSGTQALKQHVTGLLDADGATRGNVTGTMNLGQAYQLLRMNANAMEGGIGGATGSVLQLLSVVGPGAAVVVAFGAAAITATNSFVALSDKVRLGAEETGLSQQTYQALGYESKALGVSTDTVTRSMDFMARSTETLRTEIEQGKTPSSQYADALRTLGINLQAFIAMPADERLRTLNDAFAAFPDKTRAAGLAMDVFSRGGYQMIPFLDAGNTALDTWSQRVLTAGASVASTQPEVLALHESSAQLRLEWDAFSLTVGSRVVPVLAAAGDKLGDLFGKLNDLLQLVHQNSTAQSEYAAQTEVTTSKISAQTTALITAGATHDQVRAQTTAHYQQAKIDADAAGAAEDAYLQQVLASARGGDVNSAALYKHDAAFRQLVDSASAARAVLAAWTDQASREEGADKSAADATAALAASVKAALPQFTALGLTVAAAAQGEQLLDTVSKAAGGSTASLATAEIALGDAQRMRGLSGEQAAAATAALAALTKDGDASQKLYATDVRDFVTLLADGYTPQQLEAALATARLTAEQAKLDPVLKQLQSDLLADAAASTKFATDLATGAQTGAAQFAALYGAAAQSAASSLHSASAAAVQAWQQADATVLSDEQGLTRAMSAEDQARLEHKLAADQLILQAAVTTANQAIADEQSYVAAVRQSAQDSLTYKAKLFDNELKLSHETATEKETDLSDWLQAENIVINDILNLERMLAQETGAIDRAVTAVLIANDKARLDALAENAREATATAAANAADIKIDDSQARKDAAALRADQAAQIEGMHGLVSQQTDLNSVQQAGIELEKQGLDLQKQVKETGALVTADQLAGLHAVTEANRGVAQSELAAAQAAQAHYADVVASIDLATGFSTKYSQQEIDLAKAQYENSQRLLNQGVSNFDAALAAEQKAQSTFDSQQQASAAATVQLAADRRSLAAAELSSTLALTTAAVEGAGRVSDSQTQAAAQAMAAWRAADGQVLADDQALTGDLSTEDRKRLEDKRKTDQGVADDARTTAQKEIAATQDAVSAANKLDQDRRTGARTVRDLMLADAQSMNHAILTSEIDRNGQLIATDVSLAQYETGANRQRIADYQAANARVVADELALTGNLTESERNRLNAVLVSDTRIRDDRLSTAQQGIQDERDYAAASVDALNKVIGATTDAFDAQHHLNNLTAEERQAGLGQYLSAEVSIDGQIVVLETALANTTDAIARASIQSRIDGLGLLLNANKLFVHEAEVGAQDIKDAEDKAKQAAQDSMASVASSAADAGRAIQDEIKQLTAGMDAEAAAVQRVIDKYQQLQGVFGAPSTEELGLTVQADKLKIAIAQLEEQGTLSTDPRVVALQKQLDLLTPQIQAYQNERSAEEELAKSQGDLNAGMSNGIDVIRGSVQMLTALEEEQTRANKILMTFYDTTGHAVTAWADQTVSQVDRVKASYQDLIKALQDASGQQQSGAGFHAPAAGSPLPTEMFPTYAVGTNRVPNDGLAYLHRDEIVVPAGLAVGQQGPAFRPAAGPVQLVVPVTVNGTQLSPVQLQRAIQAGVGAALSEATGRDVTLAGLRS